MDSDQPEEWNHSSRKLSAQSWGNPGGRGPGYPLPQAGQAGGQGQSMAEGCPAGAAGPGAPGRGASGGKPRCLGTGDLGPGGQQDGETEPQGGAGTLLISLVNQWQDWEVRLGDSRGLGLNTRLVADEACV